MGVAEFATAFAIAHLDFIAPRLKGSFGADAGLIEYDIRLRLSFCEEASQRMPSVLVDEYENENLNATTQGILRMIALLKAVA